MSEGATRIGIDWGTTHVRAWLLADDGSVIETRRDDRGMGRLAGQPEAFARAYDELVVGWPDLPALACGMVGARQGWREAAYVPVPTALDDLARHAVRATSAAGRRLSILPGLAQAEPADVMRGEETKLAGLALEAPEIARSGVAVLPGTHAKHAALEDGRVRGFRSVFTGELFDVLGRHSILRLSLEGAEGVDESAFAAAVVEGAAMRAGELISALFNLRARSLLGEPGAEVLRGRLSGLLIGAELGLVDPAGPVALVGSGALTAPYLQAFDALGRPAPRLFDGEALVPRALAHLAARLEERGR